jgi:3-dehydroquinate dehydratase-2
MIAVLNGANLNLLGKRDPAHYGALTLQQLERQIYDWARDAGAGARCFQSNHEGAFVEHLHEAVGWASHGVIVNPGAWTHYSYAIRDAVEFVADTVPVVEVHLSNIMEREEFRRFSVLEEVAAHRIYGRGADGYREAIAWLAAHWGQALLGK